MCAIIHFRTFFISAFGRKILLSYSKPHSLSGKLERDKSYLPKCDSSVMLGKDRISFCHRGFARLSTFNEFKQLMAHSFFSF
jgi:hypothetical protein